MIEVNSTRHVLIVCLSGEVDIAAAPALSSTLATATSGDSKVLAVECSRLRFIDIAGARPLAVANRSAAALGMDFVIIAPSPAVERVLAFFDLASVVVPTEKVIVPPQIPLPSAASAYQVVDLSSSAALDGVGRRYIELPRSRQG